jgi:hypothetical protein
MRERGDSLTDILRAFGASVGWDRNELGALLDLLEEREEDHD